MSRTSEVEISDFAAGRCDHWEGEVGRGNTAGVDHLRVETKGFKVFSIGEVGLDYGIPEKGIRGGEYGVEDKCGVAWVVEDGVERN